VRTKEERKQLRGNVCSCCKPFFDATIAQGFDEDNVHTIIQNCSKHRTRHTPPSTPDGFWSVSIDTPLEWKSNANTKTKEIDTKAENKNKIKEKEKEKELKDLIDSTNALLKKRKNDGDKKKKKPKANKDDENNCSTCYEANCFRKASLVQGFSYETLKHLVKPCNKHPVQNKDNDIWSVSIKTPENWKSKTKKRKTVDSSNANDNATDDIISVSSFDSVDVSDDFLDMPSFSQTK